MAQSLLDIEAVDRETRTAGMAAAPRGIGGRVLVGASLALAGCLGAALVAGRPKTSAPARASLSSAVGLQTAWPGATTPTAQLGVGDFQQPPSMSEDLHAYFNLMIGAPENEAHGSGGDCQPNEEMFSNLCYMKCSLLTNGSHPLRTSAWTCCQGENILACGLNNQKHDVGLCSGFDVSGDGSSCPRAAGLCIANEEMFAGNCYRKCAELTNGTHPHRTSALSCCDVTSSWDCFKPSHVKLSPGYNKNGHNTANGRVILPKNTAPPALPEFDPTAVVTPR